MSNSKSQKGRTLIGSLALTLSLGSAIIASTVCAPVGVAAGSGLYDNQTTLFDQGKRDYNSGQFDQALKDLTDCIKLNPGRADLYYWRSLCYSAIHKNGEALNDLTEAVKLDPGSAVVFLNRGLIYSNDGKHELAIADFDQALKLDSSLTDARQNRDFCLKELAKIKVGQQQAQAQADQAAIAASGGSVLSIADGSTDSGVNNLGSAGGAISSASTTISSNAGQGVSSYIYKPYVGKGDGKLAALKKEQKEAQARLLREKAEVEKMDTERAIAEVKNQEQAIKQQESLASANQRARIKRQELETKKLAMAKAPVVEGAIAGQSIKGGVAQAGQIDAVKIADAENALEIVNRPVRDKWALIVGISNFQNSKLNLHYPAKDAKDFCDFLVKEGNFAQDHVKLLVDKDATRANILSQLGDKWLPRVANPDDLVLIYISSHGSPSEMDSGGINYLLAYDTDVDNLFISGLPMQDLSTVIKARVHSDRVVVVLDACHSGAAEAGGKGLVRKGNVDAEAVAQGTGQLVISSSSTSQVSWESKNYQNSVFTRCLIEALRKNGNATTLGEAFQSMRDTVQEQVLRERGVLQTPVLKSKWKGSDLRISTPPAAPRVGL